MAVPNIEYDIMTVLQSKLEAVVAYDKFMQDCDQAKDRDCRTVLEEIKADDQRHADRLRAQLKRLLKD